MSTTVVRSSVSPILLTGASGYVGGRLLARLEEGGRQVRCLTRRPDALAGRLTTGTPRKVLAATTS